MSSLCQECRILGLESFMFPAGVSMEVGPMRAHEDKLGRFHSHDQNKVRVVLQCEYGHNVLHYIQTHGCWCGWRNAP